MSLLLERENGYAHQVESTDGMLETRMLGRGVNHVGHAELLDAGESLHQRVLHNVEQQSSGNLDESEYGIVNYFRIVHCRENRVSR